MWTFLITLVGIPLLFVIIILMTKKKDWGIMLYSIPGCAITFFSPFIMGDILPRAHYDIKTQIVSVNRESKISGSFFLGCGTVGQTSYYYYYEKIGKDTYILGKQPVSETIIVEDGGAYLLSRIEKQDDKWGYGCERTVSKELHVPKGTIIKEFRL